MSFSTLLKYAGAFIIGLAKAVPSALGSLWRQILRGK